MKLNSLHEAGHWTVIPKGNKKGKMSFLLGGKKDRNRFLKSMKMEDILSEQPFYCTKCGNPIPPNTLKCPKCGNKFESNIDNILQISYNLAGKSLVELENILESGEPIKEQEEFDDVLDGPSELDSELTDESREINISEEDDYGSYKVFRIRIPASSEEGIQGYMSAWYVCQTENADPDKIKNDVKENIVKYRTFYKAGKIEEAKEALWGTKEFPILIPNIEDAQKLADKLNKAVAEEQIPGDNVDSEEPLNDLDVETIDEAVGPPIEVTLEDKGLSHYLWRIYIPAINKVVYHIWKRPQRGEPLYTSDMKKKAEQVKRNIRNNVKRYITAFQRGDKDAMRDAIGISGTDEPPTILPNKDYAHKTFEKVNEIAKIRSQLPRRSKPEEVWTKRDKYLARLFKARTDTLENSIIRRENMGILNKSIIKRRIGLKKAYDEAKEGAVERFIREFLAKEEERASKRLNPVDMDQVRIILPHVTPNAGIIDRIVRYHRILVERLTPGAQVVVAIAGLLAVAALEAAEMERR